MMKEEAYAKINLSLNVIARRPDGYHDLDMIMLPLTLSDTLWMEPAAETTFECNVPLPWDETNTIYKALEVVRKEIGLHARFRIKLEKRVPMEAGLGGGSADGAAALKLINKLLQFHLSDASLAYLASKIGSDVPFCIYNRPARVRGTGEKIEAFNIKKGYDFLLIKPEGGVSTAQAYKKLKLDKCPHPDIDAVMKAVRNHRKLNGLLGNSLEDSAFALEREIWDIKHECIALGYENVLMTGSGSTVFVLTEKGEDISELEKIMKNKYSFVQKCEILAE